MKSWQDRLHVSEVVIEQIRSLNNLDLELYKYAQDIFATQHKYSMQKLASTVSIFLLRTWIRDLCFYQLRLIYYGCILSTVVASSNRTYVIQ